ncbi:hypothetical protein C1646_774256 [Rhizophagus diaphanus]|nr:hypothetical protein C1646_774256 [Rhizophagus diaphanus] [Rhizophagus sp. MUCL 43196]
MYQQKDRPKIAVNKNKNLINNIDPETNFIISKMNSDLKNIFSINNIDIVDVIVKTIGDPTDPTPKLIRLNLSDNLLSIRKKLEKDCIINDTLSFSKKFNNEFTEIIHEDEFRLYDINTKYRIRYIVGVIR